MKRYPMLIPLIGVITGIMAAINGVGAWIGIGCILIGAILYWIILGFKNKVSTFYIWSKYNIIWVGLWFFAIGVISYSIKEPWHASNDLSFYSHASGTVLEIRTSTSGDRLLLDVDHLADTIGHIIKVRNLKLAVYSKAPNITIDDRVSLPVDLKNATDNPNTFRNDAQSFHRKGIYYTTKVEDNSLLILSHDKTLQGLSTEIRENLIRFIEQRQISRDTKSFLISILTGDRAFMTDEMRTMFSDGGLSHVLALSGMHIGIIVGIFLILLFPINFTGRYQLRYIAIMVCLWIYAFITGMSPSTIRACIMTTFFFIGYLMERKTSPLNALCLAGFLILVLDPLSINDVGFQLSFLCVCALILIAPHCNPIEKRRHPRIHWMVSMIVACVVATAASWVVTAWYFGQLPLMFLPLNLLILPLLPIYMVFALIYFAIEAIGINAGWLASILDSGFEAIKNVLQIPEEFANSVLHISVSETTVILWLIGILLIGLAVGYKKRYPAVLAIGCMTGALIPLFTTKAEAADMIICDTYNPIEYRIKTYTGDTLISVSPKHSSMIKVNSLCILTLRDSIPESIPESPDYVVLTGDYKEDLSGLTHLAPDPMIVIHPSMRKEREKILIEEAVKLNLKVHSLRNNKALSISTKGNKNGKCKD